MAAKKTIWYTPKDTSANTQYVSIEKDDMIWLKLELARYLAFFGELENSNNKDIQQIVKNYWHKTDKKLPRGSNGLNSPVSFVSGLYNNLSYKGQRDLSNKVLEPIEEISNTVFQLEEAIEELYNVTNLQKTSITFLQSINQYVL